MDLKRDGRRDLFQFMRDLAVSVFGFNFFFPHFILLDLPLLLEGDKCVLDVRIEGRPMI